MKYEAILYEKHGAVAKIITNRPRYKNAQSRLMIEEMDHAFAVANADDDDERDGQIENTIKLSEHFSDHCRWIAYR